MFSSKLNTSFFFRANTFLMISSFLLVATFLAAILTQIDEKRKTEWQTKHEIQYRNWCMVNITEGTKSYEQSGDLLKLANAKHGNSVTISKGPKSINCSCLSNLHVNAGRVCCCRDWPTLPGGKNTELLYGHHRLGTLSKKKKRYYLGIFPNMGEGGSSQTPKLL